MLLIEYHTHLSLDAVELIVRNRLCYLRPEAAATQRVLIRHLHSEIERERKKEKVIITTINLIMKQW